MKLEQVMEQLNAKKSLLKEAISAGNIEEIKSLTLEVKGLTNDRDALVEAEAAAAPVNVTAIESKSQGIDYTELKSTILSGQTYEVKAAATTQSGAPGPQTRTNFRFGPGQDAPVNWDYLRVENLTTAQASYLLSSMSVGAAYAAEGTAPTESDFAFTDNAFTAKPVSVHRVFSDLALLSMAPGDYEFVLRTLTNSVYNKAIAQYFSGAGGASGWTGLSATSNISTQSASGISLWSAIVQGRAKASGKDGINADTIAMHWNDWAKLAGSTDENTRPILDILAGPNAYTVAGLRVVLDNSVASGSCYIFNRDNAILATVGGLRVKKVDLTDGSMSQRLELGVFGNTIVHPYSVCKITNIAASTNNP